jgi:hypothetical protein
LITRGDIKVWTHQRYPLVGPLVSSSFGVDFSMRQRISFQHDFYVRQRAIRLIKNMDSNSLIEMRAEIL